MLGLNDEIHVRANGTRARRTVVHILSDSDPGNGFESVEGGLEDVYSLAHSRQAA